MPGLRRLTFFFLVLAVCAAFADDAASYQYFRFGNQSDSTARPSAGIAMMGGGSDLDEAFRWLCTRAGGGDFLVLRARGDDDYNSYVNGLCKVNSVATLMIPSREAALDPVVAETIRHAEAIFIAGGDQARYINFWMGTPVQEAINTEIARGVPIGGTSAGLAVLGEFTYGALGDAPNDDNLSSAEVLRDPYFRRVTLVRGFLKNPQLRATLTDSHFAKRDRMGRSLVFLARIMQDGWSDSPREIAVDEGSAVLLEPDGEAVIVGPGKGAFFIQPSAKPTVCREKTPLTLAKVSVYHAPRGSRFDVATWQGSRGVSYSLSVEEGVIHSTQPGGGVY